MSCTLGCFLSFSRFNSTFNIIAMEKIQNFLFIPASVTITDTVNVNECSCCLILLQWLLIVFIYVPLSNDIKYSVILFHLQACMAGIVFAKFTKPTMRAETILFSKNALITVRNGSMYLVCRIADLRFLKKYSKNNIFIVHENATIKLWLCLQFFRKMFFLEIIEL